MVLQQLSILTADADDPLAYFRQRYGTKRSDEVGLLRLAKETKALSQATSPKSGRIRSDNPQPEHNLSDQSDRTNDGSGEKKSSNISTIPTYPTNPTGIDATETETGRQAQVISKCVVCGTSIHTDHVAGLLIAGGLAHRSCVELGIPSRRR